MLFDKMPFCYGNYTSYHDLEIPIRHHLYTQGNRINNSYFIHS